ncbi:hypothetical protein CJJ07_003351 [Candidozyma auris]|nr:hypothetical protein CJJ07_003351 [[Candida] auris]QEL61846.1 hypothetical protein CJJ09_004003 [[Candida] auris]
MGTLAAKEQKDSPQNTSDHSYIRINAKWIAVAHGVFALTAFLGALVVGCYLHYEKIVQNASYGYPDEWFPSVSATIGDRYPERSVFQIFIAVTSGPRFLLIFTNFLVLYHEGHKKAWTMLISGLLRTFTCGGWVYITSTDDHDAHDVFMISYIVLTIPWTICMSSLSKKGSLAKKGRVLTALSFFGSLVPLVYFFIQHKVHVIAGAYSYYAYIEWSLIFLDVAFDTWSYLDFSSIELRVLGASVDLIAAETQKVEKTKRASIDEDFDLATFVVNTINSFTLMTGITAMFACVWYFPLWHMGVSGYEAVIIVMFIAPIFALPLRPIIAAYPFIPRAAAVILTVGAWKVPDPANRLMTVSAGVGFSVLGLTNELMSLQSNPKRFTSYFVSLFLGVLSSSAVKYLCCSNNPAWPIMHKENGGYNELAFFITMIAALFTRPPKKLPEDLSFKPHGGSFLLAALGLAGYLFSLTAFVSDSSIFVIWSWTGFPIKGPTPVIGGLIHFAAAFAGVITSIRFHPNILAQPIFTLVGALASGFVFYAFPDWLGFAGSTVFTFFIASISPTVAQSVLGYCPIKLLITAYFIHIGLCFMSVWIVAYAFVPGGPMLRERSDIMVGITVISVALAVLNYLLRKSASKITRIEVTGGKLFKNAILLITVLTAIISTGFTSRYQSSAPQPYKADTRSFTAGIWCVHFGLDNDLWASEIRMSNLLREAEVDIIGLLETDTERLIGGNRDFVQRMAEELGMYVDYGPGPNKHTWGAALLSKFPILESEHHLLPSPVGELAPAIKATLDIYGELIDVVVFHSGQEEDPEDRRLQSLYLEELMGNSQRPMVLLSYLVTEPLQGNYFTYSSEKSRMHDIDSTDWDRWCEYIMFRDLKKVAYARISRSTITDTELQIAKFKFLTDEQTQLGDAFIYGNHFISEDEVSPDLRMPSLFRGEGVRGHRYHVFDEPRYFAESADQVAH